jgi:hypothetical protein
VGINYDIIKMPLCLKQKQGEHTLLPGENSANARVRKIASNSKLGSAGN